MNRMSDMESNKSKLSSQINAFRSSTKKHTTDERLAPPKKSFFERCLPSQTKGSFRLVIERCRVLLKKPGVHSIIALNSAGFHYTGDADTTRCDACNLEVSGWTLDMKPFEIHSKRSPDCPFVRSILSNGIISRSTTESQKKETTEEVCQSNPLIEVNALKVIRKQTFSHWSFQLSPSSAQMIAAGFFACNVGDRVICLYCNIICQGWIPNTDDPFEVHKTLSPMCPYVIATLKCGQTLPLTNNATFQWDRGAFHKEYIRPKMRRISFVTWPSEYLPLADELVRAGFFYTGNTTVVTCFYCNGSLPNWTVTDNPSTKHAYWFPYCAYAKYLCGDELYRRIQDLKRSQYGNFELPIPVKIKS